MVDAMRLFILGAPWDKSCHLALIIAATGVSGWYTHGGGELFSRCIFPPYSFRIINFLRVLNSIHWRLDSVRDEIFVIFSRMLILFDFLYNFEMGTWTLLHDSGPRGPRGLLVIYKKYLFSSLIVIHHLNCLSWLVAILYIYFGMTPTWDS